jgi:hypothetical protein
MAINNKIRCASCRYARQDKSASTYTKKHCRSCANWADCPVCADCKKCETCKSRIKQTNSQSCGRRCDTVCPAQTLTWKAVECGNPDSEYHKALLNVTTSGDMQHRVTWNGCAYGERRCGL